MSKVTSTVYITPPSLIFSHTMMFIAAADGETLISRLILPAKIAKAHYSAHYPSRFVQHSSQKDWMNKELLENILLNYVATEIQQRMNTTVKPVSRALLIFDGHGSRNQPDLWHSLAAQGVDSVCHPSHCSSDHIKNETVLGYITLN
ncbi:hypothetical protein BLNAU_22923 [Blattamonas nauphoetae]|uniref:DDE-1 domain-containing protein n=1 Tax=Blattamonas nauphoetae TaxID=2049346 RepID=A0ABQ9WRR1_9EUKA|nr:hypothetical protein BLNAU_22923 [Blattamonas nauphoetae]